MDMSDATKTATSDEGGEIATVRIELIDTDPLIWREVEVPTAITLKQLHDVVQAAMGWLDYHLWEFMIDGGRRSASGAGKVRLADLIGPRGAKLGYLYDFGDSWEHLIAVGKPRPRDPTVSYPRYVGGEQNAPPDDSGGIPGFYALLETLADPRHPSHADMKEWAGDYDPAALDEAGISRAISSLADRWARAEARRRRKAQ
jgi:hypothetical protein